MYTRILTPLDGSARAEQVLPCVYTLAEGLGASIELLRMFDPASEETSLSGQDMGQREVDDGFYDRALAYLNGVRDALPELEAPVICTVDVGTQGPAHWIVTEAEREADTLVAMTPHGRSGLSRVFLGSVTDKVLQTTSAPVLLVRNQENANRYPAIPEVPLRYLIVPLDGSTVAEQSIPHALGLAKALELGVRLVRVESDESSEDRVYLYRMRDRLGDQGLEAVEAQMRSGDAAEQIIQVAEETPDSLVIMTTHGRSGIGRLVLGSVTDEVVRHSARPVLAIRARS